MVYIFNIKKSLFPAPLKTFIINAFRCLMLQKTTKVFSLNMFWDETPFLSDEISFLLLTANIIYFKYLIQKKLPLVY